MKPLPTGGHITVRAALYLRVSTEDQKTKGFSLPEQLDLCRKKAEELTRKLEKEQDATAHLEMVEFEDAISGDFLERPALDLAREFVRDHKPDFFICLDPDRFSRMLKWQLLVADEIEARGTKIEFVQQSYDPNDPMSRAFFQFRGIMSELDKAKIIERTTRGRRGKLKQGLLASYVPLYGYRFNKETSNLDVFEPEASWVRQLFKWALQRMRPGDMVENLNAAGVLSKRGGKWYTSTVRSILSNQSYTGRLICNRYDWTGAAKLLQLPKHKRTAPIRAKLRPEAEWITIGIPVVIAPEMFEQVRASARHNKAQSKKGTELLSGIMRCGLCGGPVHYIPNKSNGYVLRCFNRYPRRHELKNVPEPCKLPHVRYTIIEKRVWEQIHSWFDDPDALVDRLRRDSEGEDRSEEIADIHARLAQMQTQSGSLRKEQLEIIRAKSKGLIDEETADSTLQDLKGQIGALTKTTTEWQGRLEYLVSDRERSKALREQIIATRGRMEALSHKLSDILDAMNRQQRQDFLRAWVKEVVLKPGRQCEVHPLYPGAS